MSEKLKYRCVNCGEPSAALFKTYGPSVLKLTKCEKCKGIVDKYIEYDPVIVMIDLVLISKEAQRHIIYNTEFKSYWKLFIILTMLETFGVWRNDSLFNIAVNSICDIKNNNTINTTYITLPFNYTLPEPWKSDCGWWVQEEREEGDIFIWEKDFYIQFLSTLAGIVIFILTVHLMMTAMTAFSNENGRARPQLRRLLRASCVAQAGALGALPALVWGAPDAPGATRLLQHALAAGYGCVLYYSIISVAYEARRAQGALALAASLCLKCCAVFRAAPAIRRLV